MGIIFYLSNQPALPSVPGIWIELQDIAGHFIEYAVLAGLLRWALAGAGVQTPDRWAFLLSLAYALSDEFHQSFVPGRHPDPFDIVTDAAGALFALAALRLWRTQRVRRMLRRDRRAIENAPASLAIERTENHNRSL
jgi:hypothetical protein